MGRRRREVRRHPAKMPAASRSVPAHGARPPRSEGLTTGRELDMFDHYKEVFASADGARRLAWGSMVYACRGDFNAQVEKRREADGLTHLEAVNLILAEGGPHGCGFERRVLLCIGVEGPPDFRSDGKTIPCPANAGRCPECGHGLAHVRWNEDEVFSQFRTPRPDEAFFQVPTVTQARRFAKQGYGGAELVEPRA